jgi:hypothetical protein
MGGGLYFVTSFSYPESEFDIRIPNMDPDTEPDPQPCWLLKLHMASSVCFTGTVPVHMVTKQKQKYFQPRYRIILNFHFTVMIRL